MKTLAKYGNGYNQTQRIYSIEDTAPTIWNMSHDTLKIAVPIAKLEGFDSYHQHNYVYGEDGISPTILRNCEKGYPPLIQVAELSQGGYDIRKRIYSPEGIAPTVYTCGGGGCEPKILVGEEPRNELVEVGLEFTNNLRPDFDSIDLARTLKDARKRMGLSVKEVAEIIGVPFTEAEHWFRTDRYNTPPSVEVWGKVRDLFGIEGWDVVGESYESPNTFEMRGRAYRDNGLAPTITVNLTSWVVRG